MVRPKRGEVWLVDFGYVGKRRPCVVLSVALQDEDNVLAAVVPRTTHKKGTRFEASTANELFRHPGVFDAQMLQGISCSKFEFQIGALAEAQLEEVEAVVKRWLGFE
jgi:mRNA interferase MazF